MTVQERSVLRSGGVWSVARLLARGFTRRSIEEAVRDRSLVRRHDGFLMAGELHRRVTESYRPGDIVTQVKDGVSRQLQVVSDPGTGRLRVIDPSRPDASVEEVGRDEVGTGEPGQAGGTTVPKDVTAPTVPSPSPRTNPGVP